MTLREEIEAAGIVLPVRVAVPGERHIRLSPNSRLAVVGADNRCVITERRPVAHAIARALNAAGEASDE